MAYGDLLTPAFVITGGTPDTWFGVPSSAPATLIVVSGFRTSDMGPDGVCTVDSSPVPTLHYEPTEIDNSSARRGMAAWGQYFPSGIGANPTIQSDWPLTTPEASIWLLFEGEIDLASLQVAVDDSGAGQTDTLTVGPLTPGGTGLLIGAVNIRHRFDGGGEFLTFSNLGTSTYEVDGSPGANGTTVGVAYAVDAGPLTSVVSWAAGDANEATALLLAFDGPGGEPEPAGGGAGTMILGGSVEGSAAAEGGASGAVVLGGSASGSSGSSGSGSGVMVLGGSSEGQADADGSGSGALVLGGAAEGQAEAEGGGSGTMVLGGSAAGPGVSLDLSTEFDEGALPAGWTFETNSVAGNATIDHADDLASITIPAGTTADSIFSVGSTEGTAGLVHDLPAGDFDVAVRIGENRNDDNSTTYGFILRDDTDGVIRWTPYATAGTRLNVYGYARSGGSGSNFQPAALLSSAAGLPGGSALSGSPAWYRVRRVGTLFTFSVSYNGVDWYDATNTLTSAIDPTEIKLAVGQVGDRVGQPFSFDAVVDLGVLGGSDARGALPVYYRDSGQSVTDFSGGVPAWLDLDSAVDGTATVVGDAVRLSTAPADGSYARLYEVGAGTAGGYGTLLLIEVDSPNAATYAALGLGVVDGGGEVDQYSGYPTVGYETQLVGTATNNQAIKSHRPYAPGHATLDEAYSFLRADEDWDASTPPSTPQWYRIERYEGWVFIRSWADGDPEPTTWSFASPERTLRGPSIAFVGVAHNDGSGGNGALLVREVHAYPLVDTLPIPEGSGSGAMVLGGQASGSSDYSGGGSGSMDLDGGGAGAADYSGGGSGQMVLGGSASGSAPSIDGASGGGSGTMSLGGSASGQAAYSGSASGAMVLGGSASGVAPDVAPPAGGGSGVMVLGGQAAGSAAARGGGSGTMLLGGRAAGPFGDRVDISILIGETRPSNLVGATRTSNTVGETRTSHVVGETRHERSP